MQPQQTLIVRQSLELGTELGQGEFGSVLKGVWTDPKGNKVKVDAKGSSPYYLAYVSFNASPEILVANQDNMLLLVKK